MSLLLLLSSGSGDENRILLCLTSLNLEYSIHGKELGSILLRHRIRKNISPDLASTRFWIPSVFKNFDSGERIQKLQNGMPNSRMRVGGSHIRKGFKNSQIRVDGASVLREVRVCSMNDPRQILKSYGHSYRAAFWDCEGSVRYPKFKDTF